MEIDDGRDVHTIEVAQVFIGKASVGNSWIWVEAGRKWAELQIQ